MAADCPWKMGDKLPGKKRGAARNYHVMSVEELCRLTLPPMHDNAYLFLWRLSAMVEEAYRVGRTWGFTPKSEIVWKKLTKYGKPWMGMGRSVRVEHEVAIIFTRGRAKPLSRSERSILEAKVPVGADGKYIHSAKPPEFYDKVMRLCGGPYVELFARGPREGWVCVGNQMPAPMTLPSRPA